jgi:transposase
MTLFQLRPSEYGQLSQLAHQTHDAAQLRRAQALLWLHQGWPAGQVADLLLVSRQTVYHWVGRFHDRADLDLPDRLLDAPRSGRPATASGVIDPLVDGVIDRDPRDWGYHATVWTAPLLQHYLQDVHGIETSCKSIRRAIARLRIRWKRPRHRLGLRPDTWRQAKGGSKTACKTGCVPCC